MDNSNDGPPRIVGCSLLPVCRDRQYGNVYFILGRERRTPCWKDADRWADFSGSVKYDVDGIPEPCEETAAREAWEETAAILRFSPDADIPVESYEPLRQRLENGDYVVKIMFANGNTRYVTYVYEVPFDPSITTRFSHLMKLLTQRLPHTRATEETQRLSNSGLRALFQDRSHPSIDPATGTCDRSFTEKAAVGLFSIPSLLRALKQDGMLVHKFARTEYMRINFQSRLAVILKAMGYMGDAEYSEWKQAFNEATRPAEARDWSVRSTLPPPRIESSWAYGDNATMVADDVPSISSIVVSADSSESDPSKATERVAA